MNLWKLASAVTTLILSASVNAAIVTQGALTSYDDGTSNIITDSLNQREYIRFDVLAPLTYAQTLSSLSTQEGSGWTIAGEADALKFVDAFFDSATHNCDGSTGQLCGPLNNWYDGKLGDNSDIDSDGLLFLGSDSAEVGLIFIDNAFDELYVQPSWGTIIFSDKFSISGSEPLYQMSWLAYRDVSTVPVPSAVWLFGSGLMGLVAFSRRKKHRS